MRRFVALFAPLVLAAQATLSAHPAPFSYVDVHVDRGRTRVTVVAHAIDVAHDLQLAGPEVFLEPKGTESRRDAIVRLITGRLRFSLDGRSTDLEADGVESLPDRQAIRLQLQLRGEPRPSRIHVDASLFPYDPNHQTFVNIYEDGRLVQQSILSDSRTTLDHFTGTVAGTLALVRSFGAAGIHHILIGPDHILFLVGLLLLGGGLRRLLLIVTAFTVAHSVTLSLAVLDVVNPPPQLVEPAIALSIIYVGADNLLVAGEGRDVRAWIAFAFGLIHGFGFAAVLSEIGLPWHALGWSLLSFNLGVEVGQIVVVAVIASLLEVVRRRSLALGHRIAWAGSIGVIIAGAYWFVERVFRVGYS